MSSADFSKQLVQDDRLCVTDSLKFGVFKSGQNVTTQRYKATSASPSSQTYSIQTPSEITVIDRKVVWRSTYQLTVTGIPLLNQYLVNYGVSDSLAPLPLHMSATTLQVQVNNNSVAVNVRDILPQLLRSYGDERSLSRYDGIAPLKPDTYSNYENLVGALNNPATSFASVADNSIEPRGSFYIDSIVQTSPASANGSQTVGDGVITPQTGIVTGTVHTSVITFTSYEPLWLSPFHFANLSSNQQGVYGVSNMNFIFNIGQMNRILRFGNTAARFNYLPAGATGNAYSGDLTKNLPSVTLSDVQDAYLIFQMLTPHPSQLLPSKNVCDYVDFPRFLTTQLSAVPSATYDPAVSQGILKGTASLTSNNIQLNQIPDMLLICVRKPMASQNNADADAFLPISRISINWNNQSGLLANADQQTLFRMSAETTNQTWNEFRGRACAVLGGGGANSNPIANLKATSGSLLALKFGQHIPIVEDFYSAGSLGSFNLQFTVDVENFNQYPVTPEICLVCVNSGLFITSQGVSSVYTGILTKQDVLSASEQKPVSQKKLRLIGGVSSSVLNSVSDVAPQTQHAIMDAVKVASKDLRGGESGGLHHRIKM
jgi:hypothetical protein